MKVLVDRLPIREFGRAAVRGQTRFYYRVIGYDFLIIRTEGKEFHELVGQPMIALFEFDSINGRIICQKFPAAPTEWAGIAPGEGLTQVSLVPPDWRVIPGKRSRMKLSGAIRSQLGNFPTGD